MSGCRFKGCSLVDAVSYTHLDVYKRQHGNCEKWNKFQLVGFENHSLFSNGSISIFIDDKSGSGNIRDKFLLVSGYGCGRNLKFLQFFIQINSAGTAFFTVCKNNITAGEITDCLLYTSRCV